MAIVDGSFELCHPKIEPNKLLLMEDVLELIKATEEESPIDCSLDSPEGSSITDSKGLGNPVLLVSFLSSN